ncbi:uncharacterized protein BP5553_07663 [Venustampulla echinocandica]|uniref:WSC domain-containing protein n=1 Tax=Venustampulla echinocandica TaxID=2656787 RepID=A0A370TH57_9HELO|nr:uncharacterized protein BP5553_07663 [Venustampulla echinocandica]RDL34535.1 hypothetical protein BP5553_07663 [Venustampulla echinocandica]
MAFHPFSSLTRCWSLIVALLLCAATVCRAQATTTAPASIFPGTASWAYQGCYNETTTVNGTNGLRALNGGINSALDTMTVPICLNFCADANYAFAGLEYTRECYCARYVSSLSSKLPDSSCNLPCKGNSSQICGGSLSLSVYQVKSSKEGSGIKVVREAPVGSVLALGIAMGVSLYLA